jgi:hypothetical protein
MISMVVQLNNYRQARKPVATSDGGDRRPEAVSRRRYWSALWHDFVGADFTPAQAGINPAPTFVLRTLAETLEP